MTAAAGEPLLSRGYRARLLAVLLARFRFDATAATKPWPVQRLTTHPRGGLPMRISRR